MANKTISNIFAGTAFLAAGFSAADAYKYGSKTVADYQQSMPSLSRIDAEKVVSLSRDDAFNNGLMSLLFVTIGFGSVRLRKSEPSLDI